jgi:hypothetical protein
VHENNLIYDWNLAGHVPIPPGTQVLVNDETLRDGLQNPSIHDPTIEEKIEILHLMEDLGIDSVNIGLPGAGPRAAKDVEALAHEIANHRMRIKPNCAARSKRTSGPSSKFRSASEFPSKRLRFLAPARFAGWWKIGLSITWSALRKKP